MREFTLGAANAVYPVQPGGSIRSATVYPKGPVIVEPEKAKFISKMVMSELLELLLTIEPSTFRVKKMMHEIIDDLDLPTTPIPNINSLKDGKDEELVAKHGSSEVLHSELVGVQAHAQILVIEAQMDAVVDIMYYLLDFCTKQGYNIDRVFDLVHNANMAKRHEDGKFHKREDGKVIKPKDWQEANLTPEVLRQIEHGAWTA